MGIWANTKYFYITKNSIHKLELAISILGRGGIGIHNTVPVHRGGALFVETLKNIG
jgi:hypothetical protein